MSMPLVSMPIPSMRIAALSLLSLTISACVTFERAPVAELDCDPALAGEWRPLKDGRSGPPIQVSADCSVRWPEDDGGIYTTTLEGFELGGSRYFVFTPTVADRLMSADDDMRRKAPKDSVFIARYRIDGDTAQVWLADPDEAMRHEAMHSPAKGQANAVQLDGSNVHIQGSRDAIAALLRARGDAIFATKPDGKGVMRLQRVPAAAAP